MSYITAVNLLNHLGAAELAVTVRGKLNKPLDADLLKAVINGGDTSAFQADAIECANQALALINNAINETVNMMNGYLPKHHQLPLSTAVIEQSPLPLICIKITRYELSLLANEQITQDKKDALQQLRDISKGLIVLGSDSPTPTTSSHVRVSRSQTSSLTTGFGR